jgi:hypothetical protein
VAPRKASESRKSSPTSASAERSRLLDKSRNPGLGRRVVDGHGRGQFKQSLLRFRGGEQLHAAAALAKRTVQTQEEGVQTRIPAAYAAHVDLYITVLRERRKALIEPGQGCSCPVTGELELAAVVGVGHIGG